MISLFPQKQYVIDTSAFIDMWNRHYRPTVFVTLWDNFLAKAMNQGMLIAPRMVLTELERRDDAVATWAKLNKQIFIDVTQEQLNHVADIIKRFPKLVDDYDPEDADPYLIALALEKKLKYIITYETMLRNPKKPFKLKLPEVSPKYGLRCIWPMTFFSLQKWEL